MLTEPVIKRTSRGVLMAIAALVGASACASAATARTAPIPLLLQTITASQWAPGAAIPYQPWGPLRPPPALPSTWDCRCSDDWSPLIGPYGLTPGERQGLYLKGTR